MLLYLSEENSKEVLNMSRNYSKSHRLPEVGPGVQRLWKKGVIKKDRLRLEISQKSFAKMLGVSIGTLRKWESDKMKPSLEHAQDICRTLRVLKVSRDLPV